MIFRKLVQLISRVVNYNSGQLAVLGVLAALVRRRRPPAVQDAQHAACSVYLVIFWREGGARTVSEQLGRRWPVAGGWGRRCSLGRSGSSRTAAP